MDTDPSGINNASIALLIERLTPSLAHPESTRILFADARTMLGLLMAQRKVLRDLLSLYEERVADAGRATDAARITGRFETVAALRRAADLLLPSFREDRFTIKIGNSYMSFFTEEEAHKLIAERFPDRGATVINNGPDYDNMCCDERQAECRKRILAFIDGMDFRDPATPPVPAEGS